MNAFAGECIRAATIVALSLSLTACRQAKPFAEKVADNEEYIFGTMENAFPKLRKIGAVSPNGECSPFVWKGRLMRMELSDPTGALDADDPRVCIRILDTGTGEVLSMFGRDCYYPAAFVDGERLLVTATKRTYWLRGETEPTSHCGESISLFESTDLVHWTERTLFERPGWAFFNTSLASRPSWPGMSARASSVARATSRCAISTGRRMPTT